MPIDPVSGIINGIGLFMQQDAAAKAADAANNNRIQQLAMGATNVEQQNAVTNHTLAANDEIMRLLRDSSPETAKLINDIIGRQTDFVDTSANKLNTATRDDAGIRGDLARTLASRDIGTAQSSVDTLNRNAAADRTDVYGNRTFYDPTTSGFKTSLSSPQTDLVRGYNTNEKARTDALGEAIAKARFSNPTNEASIRSELTGLMTDADAQKLSTIQDAVGRQAIRMGQGGSIPALIKAIQDQLGSQLPQTLLNARNQAASEFQTRENGRVSRDAAGVNTFSAPLAQSSSIVDANNERRGAVDNLSKTLANNAGIAERATTSSGNRLMDAQNKNIEDVISTLKATEGQRGAVRATGDALQLQNQSTDIQRMIDALTQREGIWTGAGGRLNTAITGTATAANTAATTNVNAIGKEAPNATMVNNLAKNFSFNDAAKGKTASGDDRSNEEIIQQLVAAMG